MYYHMKYVLKVINNSEFVEIEWRWTTNVSNSTSYRSVNNWSKKRIEITSINTRKFIEIFIIKNKTKIGKYSSQNKIHEHSSEEKCTTVEISKMINAIFN